MVFLPQVLLFWPLMGTIFLHIFSVYSFHWRLTYKLFLQTCLSLSHFCAFCAIFKATILQKHLLYILWERIIPGILLQHNMAQASFTVFQHFWNSCIYHAQTILLYLPKHLDPVSLYPEAHFLQRAGPLPMQPTQATSQPEKRGVISFF